MDYLLEFSYRDDIRALARRYLQEAEAVQGITVDLDDLWLEAWRIYNTVPLSRVESELSSLVEWFAYSRLPLHTWFPRLAEAFTTFPYGVDTSWRPAWWESVSEAQGLGPEPFVLTVVLRPQFSEERWRGLQEIDPEGVRVRFEARPVARLYRKPRDRVRPVVGGLSVSTPRGDAGTLGGVLQDANGRRFALTCSHVMGSGAEAQQPSPVDKPAKAERIGQCLHSTTLRSHVPPLDPYDPSINVVDAALIGLDDQVGSELEVMGIGPLGGIASKSHAHPNSAVDIAGKEAGHRRLYIGGAVLVHEFDFKGQKYGYRNLFELKRASRFHGVTGTLSHPVSPGDSGAWVMRSGLNGPEWLGVVVAGDGPYGYATPSEFITGWIANQTTVGSVEVV